MRAALITVALAAVAVPAAGADSIVYVKDSNVWLANANASGQSRGPRAGPPPTPYEPPPRADAGTPPAARGARGGRRQLSRRPQGGGLLTPPINTPAPGTGAIDA